MKKSVLILSTIFLAGAFAVFVGRNEPDPVNPITTEAAASPTENYDISVAATAISAYEVSLNITTNIPLPVEVMASVSIKDQIRRTHTSGFHNPSLLLPQSRR